MTLLVVHAAATWFMVGLIWTIQSVHYPLFASAADLAGYEAEHSSRMVRLLSIPAGLEILTGAGLVWIRPDEVGLWLVLGAGVVLVAIWITTALVQVPLHQALGSQPDVSLVVKLVRGNWIRTGLWTVRGLLVAVMLAA